MVTLGYAEPVDSEFYSEPFPNKIGGKPRWLDPTRPLESSLVLCEECNRPMVLLMQLYAPEDEPAEAFHRVLYIFTCRNGACHRGSARGCMRAIRSQLPEENRIYQKHGICSDENDDDFTWEQVPGTKHAKLCVVCGLAGTKQCSKCHTRYYCSREHQILDWDAGHKKQCMTDDAETPAHLRTLASALFPEQIITSEEEDDEEDDSDEEGEDTRNICREDGALVPATNEKPEDSKVEVDKAFLLFQMKIQTSPDQVIRYARTPDCPDPTPLYVSDSDKPTDQAIGICSVCSEPRVFEFQIMPQMLNYLSVDSASPTSIDWGTLLIYSCPKSCHHSSFYTPEAICRQTFSSQGIGEKYVRAYHGDDTAFSKQFENLNV